METITNITVILVLAFVFTFTLWILNAFIKKTIKKKKEPALPVDIVESLNFFKSWTHIVNKNHIITNYLNLNSTFINFWVEEKDGFYIISDMGWLIKGYYEVQVYDQKLIQTLQKKLDIEYENDKYFVKIKKDNASGLIIDRALNLIVFIQNVVNYHILKKEKIVK
jgi:hypothetical protein